MIHWFLGNLSETDRGTLRDARLIISFSIGTCIAGLIYIPVLYYMSGYKAGLFLLATSLLTGSTGFVMRWTGNKSTTAQYYLFSLWMLISGVVVLLGGDVQPSLPSFAVVILGATFLIGPRSGIGWTLICIVTTIVVQPVIRSEWLPIADVPERLMVLLYISSVVTVLLLVCLFALLYEKAKNSALDELREVGVRTQKMIAQLGIASERLVYSSEEFLGTQSGDKAGLVSQMMLTARAGRDSIATSRESILGMIEQYRHIALRVQNLHKYSQVIVELVSAIDRISSRLDLMALNVGIEAARSGEAGRQFTILAKDMRSLAERVITETSRIESALHNIHGQIQEVRESSRLGQVLTEESVEKMSSMLRTFDQIYGLISETEKATEKITADTLAQINAVRLLMSMAADQRSQ